MTTHFHYNSNTYASFDLVAISATHPGLNPVDACIYDILILQFDPIGRKLRNGAWL